MPTHGDRITMSRHMVLLGALGAGAFGGRQRGDGFQLRLVLERETHPRQPQITHHASACRNPQRPRQRPPSHDFGYVRIRSLVLPSNEHAIQRDPNEVIIGM
jgi:hypothetical protein